MAGATVGILEGEIEGTRCQVVVKLRDLGKKTEWETAQVAYPVEALTAGQVEGSWELDALAWTAAKVGASGYEESPLLLLMPAKTPKTGVTSHHWPPERARGSCVSKRAGCPGIHQRFRLDVCIDRAHSAFACCVDALASDTALPDSLTKVEPSKVSSKAFSHGLGGITRVGLHAETLRITGDSQVSSLRATETAGLGRDIGPAALGFWRVGAVGTF
ncbi:hypothetical protein HG531_002688 [Fusarium graminearum]|nr:hypothetical protein HG531_002688 [Fusarium graminearum]